MVLLVVRGEEVPFVDGLSEEAYENVKANLESMPEEEFQQMVAKLKGGSLSEAQPIRTRKPTRKQARDSDPMNMELWTVRQLRSYAKGRHIAEYWKLSKTDLLSHLKGL